MKKKLDMENLGIENVVRTWWADKKLDTVGKIFLAGKSNENDKPTGFALRFPYFLLSMLFS